MKKILLVVAIALCSNSTFAATKSSQPCLCLNDEPGFIYQNQNASGNLEDGGCVAEFAEVSKESFISKDSYICANANVLGNSKILGNCVITDYAIVTDSLCTGDAIIAGFSVVSNNSKVYAGARILGDTELDNTRVIRDIRVVNGTFANQTLKTSNASITAEEQLIVDQIKRLNQTSNSNSEAKKLKLQTEKRDAFINAIPSSDQITHRAIPSSLRQYKEVKVEFKTHITTDPSQHPCTMKTVDLYYYRWYYESLERNSGEYEVRHDLNANWDFNFGEDFDLSKSKAEEQSIYSIDYGVANKPPMIYTYQLHSKKKIVYRYTVGHRRYTSINDVRERDYFRFVFFSRTSRNNFKTAVEEYIKACSL